MVGVDPEIGSSALRLWIAAGTAAVLVAVCAMALLRFRSNPAGDGGRVGVIVLGAVLGAIATWSIIAGL